jgi:hypothetical protein
VGAEDVARRRQQERLQDKGKKKGSDEPQPEDERVAELAAKQVRHLNFEVENEIQADEMSDAADTRGDVYGDSDPDSASSWATPLSNAASGAPPLEGRRKKARPWQETDDTPDIPELGPWRRDPLSAPKHVGTHKLRLRNLDADRLEIVASGQPFAELDRVKEQEVLNPAGVLVLEIMQLGGEGDCRGRFDTGDAKLIRINIADTQLTNCMADGELWPMDIEARKSSTRRPEAGPALAGFQPGGVVANGGRPVPPWEKKDWDISTGWDLSQDQDRVGLRIRSLDGEWADIYLNGALLVRLRRHEEAESFMPQGKHILEVREYLADEPYCRAERVTGDTPEILIDVEQDQPIRTFNHDTFRLLDL